MEKYFRIQLDLQIWKNSERSEGERRINSIGNNILEPSHNLEVRKFERVKERKRVGDLDLGKFITEELKKDEGVGILKNFRGSLNMAKSREEKKK